MVAIGNGERCAFCEAGRDDCADNEWTSTEKAEEVV